MRGLHNLIVVTNAIGNLFSVYTVGLCYEYALLNVIIHIGIYAMKKQKMLVGA